MGFMPTPEEINFPPEHKFFDPNFVCESAMRTFSGRVMDYNFAKHGRRIRRNEKLWKNYVLPRIAELRATDEWTEGIHVNGHPL